MVMPGGEIPPYNDDTTQLVLDIVQKVLEPTIKTPIHRMTYRPRQFNYTNANNPNHSNIASISVNYKRWSNNDCTGSQTYSVSHTPYNEPGPFTHEEIILRTTKYNKNYQTNFWDRYSNNMNSYDEQQYPYYHHDGPNRNGFPVAQHVTNQQCLNNNHFMQKNSWRDNTNNYPIKPNNILHQPPIRPDNSFYHNKKLNRKHCSFCRKNGESYEFYTSHSLYENGKTSCPILKQCVCNICGQKGHTMSHCTLNASKNSILKMIHRFNSMK